MTPQYIYISEFGNKFYYKDKAMNILHREDAPAIEGVCGSKFWYLNGKLHREDGPAYEGADGSKAWFLNGVELTKKEFSNLHNSEKERKIYQFGLGVMNILYNHQEDRLSRQLERIRNAAIDLRVMDWDEKGNFNKL